MKGVLIVNLGSPEAPTAEAVKPYLDEFLMDKRVIDLPYWLRYALVKGIILNTRPKKSAAAYKKIWWDEGSPLIVISQRAVSKLQPQVDVPVELAMRYGQPSIKNGLAALYKKGVTEVLLLPMYPQYAMATTETIEVLAKELVEKHFVGMTLQNFQPFYNQAGYIDALAHVMQNSLNNFDYDHLLFSYHGVPERHIKKTDPTKSHQKIVDNEYCCQPGTAAAHKCYRTHCFETTRLVAEKLQLDPKKYSIAFQSRLGLDKWLEPFTSDRVDELAKNGVKKIAVVTPAFVADCIETLEEIEMEAGKSFKENGGEVFKMIPCLNDDDRWVNTLGGWINNWAKK